VPLEESLRLYEEGIALSRLCGEKLTKAELTLKRLGKDMEGHLALFEDSSEE
jgi:exodeoxyribonuclease VII small subunit